LIKEAMKEMDIKPLGNPPLSKKGKTEVNIKE